MIFAWYERPDNVFRWWFVMLFFDPFRDVIVGCIECFCRKVVDLSRRFGR